MTEDTTAMASGQDALGSGAVVVERVVTPRGELVLRRAQAQHEIIHNGVFLMDTRNGASERLLVRAALDACRQPRVRMLIGGLGVGFSLDEALRHPAVTEVVVIEVEEAIIRWHATHFGAHASTALEDPRTRLVNADLVAWLVDGADQFDAICLDVDNGPDWTVAAGNAALYTEQGLSPAAPPARSRWSPRSLERHGGSCICSRLAQTLQQRPGSPRRGPSRRP